MNKIDKLITAAKEISNISYELKRLGIGEIAEDLSFAVNGLEDIINFATWNSEEMEKDEKEDTDAEDD